MSFSIYHIREASKRLKDRIHHTPIVQSTLLNSWLGHEVHFKAECLQKVGAFKARGACNALETYCEAHGEPARVIANSSGNHAQAVAWACSMRAIPCTIFMPQGTSSVKIAATQSYGATVEILETRQEVDAAAKEASANPDVFWIPPYNHESVMAGQGTATLEALDQISSIDAIFAPCGGGGLISGSYVAAKALSPLTQVFGVEPSVANDAAQSRKTGSIVVLPQSPDTLADGVRTLSVGDKTFPFIQQLDGIFEAGENEIIYWTQWVTHLLKLRVEPTAVLGMIGAYQWLKSQTEPKRVLILLTGGNIDSSKTREIWQTDQLNCIPKLS